MRINVLMICLIVLTFSIEIKAQDYSNLEAINFKDKSDYPENENLVLECSNYLLNSPIEALENDLNHLKAVQFIIRWMEGTPDYMFSLDESITKVTKSNASLLSIYFASMCKFVIENKEKSSDQKEVKFNSFLTFIAYCEDTTKNVKQNKTIKELIKAKNENTLREYLNI
jgi:hypothetical protein